MRKWKCKRVRNNGEIWTRIWCATKRSESAECNKNHNIYSYIDAMNFKAKTISITTWCQTYIRIKRYTPQSGINWNRIENEENKWIVIGIQNAINSQHTKVIHRDVNAMWIRCPLLWPFEYNLIWKWKKNECIL